MGERETEVLRVLKRKRAGMRGGAGVVRGKREREREGGGGGAERERERERERAEFFLRTCQFRTCTKRSATEQYGPKDFNAFDSGLNQDHSCNYKRDYILIAKCELPLRSQNGRIYSILNTPDVHSWHKMVKRRLLNRICMEKRVK